jgi:hypothetical protein
LFAVTYASLVLDLNVTEFLAELGVLGHGKKLGDLLEVDEPMLGAKSVGNELGQTRVALEQPTSSVSHIRA